jgi:hypothetical protein
MFFSNEWCNCAFITRKDGRTIGKLVYIDYVDIMVVAGGIYY